MKRAGCKPWVGALVFWAAGAVSAATMEAADLAAGDPQAGQAKAEVCASCHAADGNSSIAIYPKLAEQNARYLEQHIKAFRDGQRVDASMQPMVEGLSDQDVADLAAYYAAQSVQVGKADPELVEQGAMLYRFGMPNKAVPACAGCHGPAGNGNAPAGWPLLSGQHPDYVAKQLRSYASGERDTDPNAMMREIASRLSDDEIAAVAQYIAGLH